MLAPPTESLHTPPANHPSDSSLPSTSKGRRSGIPIRPDLLDADASDYDTPVEYGRDGKEVPISERKSKNTTVQATPPEILRPSQEDFVQPNIVKDIEWYKGMFSGLTLSVFRVLPIY